MPIEVSIGCTVVGVLALIAYIRHARRAAHPVIKLDLLRVATFRVAVVGGFLFRVGVGAIPFLLPLLLQLGFGLNPLQSGMLTFASAAGALFMKTVATRILRHFGFRAVLTINAFVAAGSMAVIGLFTPATSHSVILTVLLIGGCFRSLQFTALNAIAYADISNRDMSSATSLTSVAQQLALSVGVALGAAVLEAVGPRARRRGVELRGLLARLPDRGACVQRIGPSLRATGAERRRGALRSRPGSRQTRRRLELTRGQLPRNPVAST